MIIFGLILALTRLSMAFQLITLEGHWLAGFTAIAHIYIGVLGRDWWYQRHNWQWRLFWFMNAIEVFSAVYSRI